MGPTASMAPVEKAGHSIAGEGFNSARPAGAGLITDSYDFGAMSIVNISNVVLKSLNIVII